MYLNVDMHKVKSEYPNDEQKLKIPSKVVKSTSKISKVTEIQEDLQNFR